MNRFLFALCAALSGCTVVEGQRGPSGKDGGRGERGLAGLDGDDGGDSRAGTRLKRQYRISEDGGRAFESWYDTQIGMPCAWMPAIDGSERCFPQDDRAQRGAFYFADPDCKVAAAFFYAGQCGALPLAITYVASGDDCERRARLLSVQIDGPPNLSTLFEDGSCFPAALSDDGAAYRLDDEIPPEGLVASAVKVE